MLCRGSYIDFVTKLFTKPTQMILTSFQSAINPSRMEESPDLRHFAVVHWTADSGSSSTMWINEMEYQKLDPNFASFELIVVAVASGWSLFAGSSYFSASSTHTSVTALLQFLPRNLFPSMLLIPKALYYQLFLSKYTTTALTQNPQTANQNT